MLNIFQLPIQFICDLLPWHTAGVSGGLPNKRGERIICFQHLPPLLALAAAPFSSQGSQGGRHRQDLGWGPASSGTGQRGAILPKTGLRGPRESAGVGGLGRAHGELGPEEILLFPLPTVHGNVPPSHTPSSLRSELASERVSEVPPPGALWVRVCPSGSFFKVALLDFLGGAVDNSPSANAEDTGSIPGPGRVLMPWSG